MTRLRFLRRGVFSKGAFGRTPSVVLTRRRPLSLSAEFQRKLNADEVDILKESHDVENKILTLKLNRPHARNALSTELLNSLLSSFQNIKGRKDVNVVVIEAEGNVFCSGHDLKEMTNDLTDKESRLHLFQLCSDVMTLISSSAAPVIAKVDGVATAAGCQLTASCDIVVASARSKFATPGVDIGLFCSTPAVALSRAVGPRHAMYMLLTGDMIPADEAERIGLVSKVVAEEELDETVSMLATKLSKKSAVAIGVGKGLFRKQLNLPLEEAYAAASTTMAENLGLPEAEEGIDAFLSKRPPEWPGEKL